MTRDVMALLLLSRFPIAVLWHLPAAHCGLRTSIPPNQRND